MEVALIGATGRVGQRLLQELIRRGHSVTAIARTTDAVPKAAAVTAMAADVSDSAALTAAIRGCAAAIISVRYDQVDREALIRTIAEGGLKRWLAVGGTGSLRDRSGRAVMDDPDLPPEIAGEARANADFFERLKELKDVAWSYISPSMNFGPGRRDGSYRTGKDDLLWNGKEPASLSFENFAVAMVDELELNRNLRSRFTVADPS